MSAVLLVLYIPRDARTSVSDNDTTEARAGDGPDDEATAEKENDTGSGSYISLNASPDPDKELDQQVSTAPKNEPETFEDRLDLALRKTLTKSKSKSSLRKGVAFDASEEDVLIKESQAEDEGESDRKDDGIENDISGSGDKSTKEVKDKDNTFGDCGLEDALQNLFDDLKIKNDTWMKTDDDAGYQISFVVPTENCDVILRRLTVFGLGNIPDTSITIFPASFHHFRDPEKTTEDKNNKDEKTTEDDCNMQKSEGEESDFFKSIKSRLIVAQVVSSVESNARATFDFIMLICLASFIAGLGLVENSSVVLVASMLISPLMGPILGGVFGFVIQNRKLTQIGIQNATIGLALCLLVGFIFGLFISGASIHGAQWGSSDSWPTTEMASRGYTRSLWVGVLIALPSGAAVALSILGGNVGSLVGVAISASLLPPAVNAGMLWAYAIIAAIKPPDILQTPNTADALTTINPLINATLNGSLSSTSFSAEQSPPVVSPVPPDCPQLFENNYRFTYSCNMASEAAILGAVSLFLTLLNILCIFIMGIIVLKIKEVAPHTVISQNKMFWKKDVPAARGYYKTIKGTESTDARKMMKDISAEMQELEKDGKLPNDAKKLPLIIRSLSYDGHTVKGIHENAENTPSSVFETPPTDPYFTYSKTDSKFFNSHSYYKAPFPPRFATPPTSVQDKKFEFPINNLRRRQPSRRQKHIQRQMSLTNEMEKQILNTLANGPQRLGRFMVSAIPEEDAISIKDSVTAPSGQPTVQLKAAPKKVPKATSGNVVVEMGDDNAILA